MNATTVIAVEGVTKTFRLNAQRPHTVKEALVRLLRGTPEAHHVALREVSLTIRAGESVSLLGSNGSGKSTLLKLITGIMRPSSGRLSVQGRVSPLLELGAGFHPEFTGRENVYLNGAILGASRQEIDAVLEAIVAFAEIGPFLEQPVKMYSSGMYMRLAFAVAIHLHSDIMIIDEVLAVGDQAFQAKCLEHLQAQRAAGKTIVFVSHDPLAVAQISDRAIWLEQGSVRMDGPPQAVIAAYQCHMTPPVAPPPQAASATNTGTVGADHVDGGPR